MAASMVAIDSLRLCQIYLSQKKIDGVLTWFDPALRNFKPNSARDFLGNGELHITDGHSRAFVAWQHGVRQIPYVYDEDEIVTCRMGQLQYREDIAWCERFGLRHISDLTGRILSEEAYEALWRGRCGKMHDLMIALEEGKLCARELNRIKAKLAQTGLYLYGISEDLGTLYCENRAGELFERAIP